MTRNAAARKKADTARGACRMVLSGLLIASAAGCAGGAERRAFEQWSQAGRQWDTGRISGLRLPDDVQSRVASDQELPEEADLDDYVHYAVRHSPELEAAFYRWRAALERVPQARALPDPRVSFALVLDEVDRSAKRMGERYAITQMFPRFGTLELRGDMALEEAHAEAQRFEAARLQLIDQVNRAYVEYAYLQQSAVIARENRDLLVRLEAVARARYRAGSAGLADVNRSQVELGRIEDQVRSLEDLRGPAAAGLNLALGRSAHAPLPPVTVRPSELSAVSVPDRSDEQWLTAARQNNPELAAARHKAATIRRELQLARRGSVYPEVSVGIEYSRDAASRMAKMDGGGSDMLMPMVSVNLPLWREKYSSGVFEALARYSEAVRRVQSREIAIEAELKRALYDCRDSRRKRELYRATLLPRARQSLAAAEAEYRAGSAGFSDMIDAQRTLLEFELAYERAAADSALARTRIQTLAGYEHPDAVSGTMD